MYMEKDEIQPFPNTYSSWMGSQGPNEYTFSVSKTEI